MKTLLILASIILLANCTQYYSCSKIIGTIDYVCIPEENLFIDSEGGDINIALEIGSMTEIVHAGKICNSSCGLILSLAEKRTACSKSSFGFHRGEKEIGTDKMIEVFESDPRIDSDFTKSAILNTPNEEMFEIDSDEALQIGLIDEVVNCNLKFEREES